MVRSSTLIQFALIPVALLALNACLLTDGMEKREGAQVESDSTAQSGCGLAGFSHFVHPVLRTNCATCHSGSGPGPGSFASSGASASYGSAKGRVNLSLPTDSLLFRRPSVAGHGPGCTNCGSALGQTLTSAISSWAQAEAGNPNVCGNLPGGSGSGGSFDDGNYNPGGTPDVTVIPEGLARFSESGGTHSILRVNCAECHIPGGPSEFAPFGGLDATVAYKAAKLRTNFIDVASSQLLQRASTDSHCGICGDPSLVSSLQARLGEWRTAEESGVAAARVSLSNKAVGVSAVGATATLSWELGSEISPASPALAGARFLINVRIQAAPLNQVYTFSNPRIVANGRSIEVRELRFIVNGTENPLIATYRTVDAVVPAGQTVTLSNSNALVTIVTAGSDQIGFAFSLLRAP